MGDGGGAGDPERTAQDPESPLGKLLRIDPRTSAGELRASRRSGCATRGASRSTATPATSGSATSARTRSRRSTPRPRDELDGRRRSTSAGRRSRAPSASTTDQEAPGASPPVLEYGARRRLLGHRRLRRPRPELDLALRPLPLRRLLRGRAAQLHRRPGAATATDDRAARPRVDAAELVRRGRRGPRLRDLARRARLPARRGRRMNARGRADGRVAASRCVVAALRRRGAAGRRRAAPRRRPGSSCGRSASFEQPTYVTQAPGEPQTVYVVEQQGRVIAVRKGRKLGAAVPRHHRPGALRPRRDAPREEAGMYSIAFDPRYPRQRPLLRLLHRPRRQQLRRPVPARGPKAVRGGARVAPPGARRSATPTPTRTTAASCSSAPTGTSGSRPATAAAAATSTTRRARLGHACSASCCGSTRGATERGYRRAVRTTRCSAAAADDAVYAWGLRNPWRFSFDRLTGNLVIADVGDNEQAREEIDYLEPAAPPAGANFGWPEYEGYPPRRSQPARARAAGDADRPVPPHRRRAARSPAATSSATRRCRSSAGRYLYADFCGGRIRSLAPPTLVDGLRAAGAGRRRSRRGPLPCAT